MSVSFIENRETLPVCPHCKKELKSVHFNMMKGDLGKRCLYFCPECRAVLGLSHRKGLTFGW